MNIALSDHFDYKKLLRFVMPSVGMMVFTSIYGVVDGFFVSNWTGKTPFAAINLIMPFLMIFSSIGFMVGTGGTALVSMRFGENKPRAANRIFSMLVYFIIIMGLILTVIGEIWLRDVALLLGATEEMLPYCVDYGRIIMMALVPFMLQNLFQSFLVAAERPQLGLYLTIAAGVANMVGDAVLVGMLRLGVTGAAWATAISQMVGGIIPLVYFALPNRSRLRLGSARLDLSALWKTCSNGASEFMTNISLSVVNMLFNFQLMRLAGEAGVAAFGVIMYVNFIFISVYIGYSMGTAPIVSFNHGAQNRRELQNIFAKSLRLIGLAAIVMTAIAIGLSRPLALLYVSYDAELLAMTEHAFRLYSLAFLLCGFNIYGSAFFTALNNGAVSAGISFLRTLLFQAGMVLLLPLLWQLDGVWLSVFFSELLSLAVTVYFWVRLRDKYGYIAPPKV